MATTNSVLPCLLALLMVVSLPVMAQEKRTLEMTDRELETQAQLNHKACQAVGLSDGGVTCQQGAYFNSKMIEAKKPKPEAVK